MEIMGVWIVYETTNEFGNLGEVVCVCKTQADAELAALGEGWYGGPGRVLERNAIINGDYVYVMETTHPLQFKEVESIRKKQKEESLKRALSKLTKDELDLIKESFK